MSVTALDVVVIDAKYHYLKYKSEVRESGKCIGCFAYFPDDTIWCHSTEAPTEKYPRGKKHSMGGRPQKIKKFKVDEKQTTLKEIAQ